MSALASNPVNGVIRSCSFQTIVICVGGGPAGEQKTISGWCLKVFFFFFFFFYFYVKTRASDILGTCFSREADLSLGWQEAA